MHDDPSLNMALVSTSHAVVECHKLNDVFRPALIQKDGLLYV
jgi:hypothetical protein